MKQRRYKWVSFGYLLAGCSSDPGLDIPCKWESILSLTGYYCTSTSLPPIHRSDMAKILLKMTFNRVIHLSNILSYTCSVLRYKPAFITTWWSVCFPCRKLRFESAIGYNFYVSVTNSAQRK